MLAREWQKPEKRIWERAVVPMDVRKDLIKAPSYDFIDSPQTKREEDDG